MLSEIVSRMNLQSAASKSLLTPSGVNPGLVKRSLALKAGSLANLTVKPMAAYFVELAAPLFPEKRFVSGDRLFFLFSNLLKTLKPGLKYFGPSVEFEGVPSLMISTIQELRLNGINRTGLQQLPMKEKWDDVSLIMDEYERLKQTRSLFDYADAIGALGAQPPQAQRTFLIDEEISTSERELATAMGCTIMGPVTRKRSPGCEVAGYRVDTPYQEALQTVRNLIVDLGTATRPVKIGICVPDYDAAFYQFVPILEKTGHRDLVHFVRGEPLFSTGPGRLWKYFNEWALNSFSIYRFLRILVSQDVDRHSVVGEEVGDETYFRAIRCYRDAELELFGRDFPVAFKRFLEGVNEGDPENEVEEKDKEAARCALGIADRFSEVHASAIPKNQLGVLARLFADCARRRDARDVSVLLRIEKHVEESITEMPDDLSLQHALESVTNTLASRYVNATLPDFDRPILGTLEDLRLLEFDKLYILGLNEHGLPRKIVQNPLLLDFEKDALLRSHPEAQFQRMEDRLRLDERAFSSLTAAVAQRIVVSAPLRDLTSGRDLLVSRYLLELWNARTGGHEDYRTMGGILARDPMSQNNYVASAPEDSFYDYESALSILMRQSTPLGDDMLLAGFFPFVSTANEARQKRITGMNFDEYWGVISGGTKDLPVFSASRLISYARCPHQYFLKYLLHLDAPEDFDPTVLDWLQAMEYGDLLHRVYFRFFVRLRDLKGAEFTRLEEADRNVLHEEFDRVVAEFTKSSPPNSPLHFRHQLRTLRSDIDGFFDRERVNANAKLFFELSFNMPDLTGRERSAGRTEPAEVVLADNTRILVRGSIDRVDRDPNQRFVLTDYKTGRMPVIVQSAPFGGGSLMQAGLYSEVAALIDRRISNPLFRYFYSTTKAGYKDYIIDYPLHRAHFIALLTAIMDEIRSGNFVPVGTSVEYFPCAYCDFVNVCMEGRTGLAARLRQNDSHIARIESIQNEQVAL